MFKKIALGVACLSLMISTSSWSLNSNCPPDLCKVDNPYQATIGVDINLDFDVCLDLPKELCSYQGCEQAVIVQAGESNSAEITQTGASFALIYQAGDSNEASTTQGVQGATALTFQMGEGNSATITQNVAASAVISQFGSYNTATITQNQ